MSLPVVAIIGRPNVGKSSLFNSIARTRISIVEPTAGVTRDRVSTICELDDRFFELVDTGGHGIVDRDDLGEHVERQIRFAIDQATLILFLVDAREGLTPLDRSTADLLRRHSDRVRIVANKVDEPHMIASLGEFMKLGYGEPIAVSAATGLGRHELSELITERLIAQSSGPAEGPPVAAMMKIALVGKRNAGKSSFINALAGEERVIVSEIPGTTRDSIDVRFEKDGRVLVAIDTAGLKKKAKLVDDIEFYAYTRATQSIERSDVVLMLIDATEPVGQVDKKLGQIIAESFKPCVIVVNKWDLAKGKTSSEEFGEYLDKVLPEINFAPVAFTSAIDGRNIDSTIDLATELFKQAQVRVGTGKLNQALQDALAQNAPRGRKGSRSPRVFYATQVDVCPPTVVVFVNDPALVREDYQRYLVNRMRESLPFGEIPIRLLFKARRAAALMHRVRSQ